MAQNTSYIRQFFEGIRDERGTHRNTATRIGTAFLLLLDYLVGGDLPYLRKDREDETSYLLRLLGGAVVGNNRIILNADGSISCDGLEFSDLLKSAGAIDDFLAGRGILLDAVEGRIQTGSLEVRGFMRVMELIINRLQLMESDYSFTEGGTVEHVVNNADGTLTLTLRKRHDDDRHAFLEGDVIYGKVNLLGRDGVASQGDAGGGSAAAGDGGSGAAQGGGGLVYYTCWMRVLSTDTSEGRNAMTVELYNGGSCDGGRNFTPQGTGFVDAAAKPWLQTEDLEYDVMMNVTRRGNYLYDEVTDAESGETRLVARYPDRQNSWFLSTTDKRLVFLRGVDSPTVGEENWAIILGQQPHLEMFRGKSIDYSLPYLFVGGLIVDHKFVFHVDYPVYGEYKIVDCGAWEQGRTYIKGIREHSDGVRERVVEQVTHGGKTWLCAVASTQSEPSDGNTDWVCTGGGKDGENARHVEILGADIIKNGQGSVTLTAYAFDGDEDVSATLPSSSWSWERESMDRSLSDWDAAWNASHVGYGRVLTVPASEVMKHATFTCVVSFSNSQT